ncbi:MAG: dynamin family protein [Pseudomonadota bacterium]
MEARRSQSRPEIDVSKWANVVNRFLADLEKADSTDLIDVSQTFGEAPTILMVGPTGSGKTALLNAMIGFSLFPEGTDHTTPVPTLIRHGNEFRLKPLGRGGEVVPHLPQLSLDESLLENALRSDEMSMLKRLYRQDDFETIRERWSYFWEPVFEAAKAGECACIEATLPVTWLPECVRLVDVPGYEGWFPEDSPYLHNLVMSWMENADCAVHVMEKTKIFLGGVLEFVRWRRMRGFLDSLFVAQMDTFHPSQVPGHGSNGSDAWTKFEEHIRTRMSEEGISGAETMSVFFGAGRLRYSSIKPQWMEKSLLSQMDLFFSEFQHDVHLARAKCAKRKRQRSELATDRFRKHVNQVKQDLEKAFAHCVSEAGKKFAGVSHVVRLRMAGHEAIDAVDFNLRELLNREKLAQRFLRATEERMLATLESMFKESLKYCLELVGKELEESLEELFSELKKQRLEPDRRALARGLADTLSNFSVAVGGSLLAILAGGVVIGAVVALLPLSKILLKSRLQSKLKGTVDDHVDRTFLTKVWDHSTKDLDREILMVVWDGQHSDGGSVMLPNGERYFGLEAILTAAHEEQLAGYGNCWRTCESGAKYQQDDV